MYILLLFQTIGIARLEERGCTLSVRRLQPHMPTHKSKEEKIKTEEGKKGREQLRSTKKH